MKIKAALKYQIHGVIRSLIVFYIVIYSLLILMAIQQAVWSHGNVHVTFSGGFEMASAIFIFVFGLNSFKSTFHMFLANGISRKTFFESYIGTAAPLAVFMALIDSINNLILSSFGNYNSMFYQVYNKHYNLASGSGVSTQVFLDGFVWMTLLYMALALIGFFITTIYYRMGKSLKLIVSIGVPVFFFMVLPYIDNYVFNGAIFEALGNFFRIVWGFADGFNPYIAVLSSFVTFAVFSGLSFLTMRKATVKK